MMADIRHASLFDIPYLSEICLKTGDRGKDASEMYADPYMLAQFYAIPYVVYSPEYCYVVDADVNRIRRPVGYIVGVESSTAFTTWLEEAWMPQGNRSML